MSSPVEPVVVPVVVDAPVAESPAVPAAPEAPVKETVALKVEDAVKAAEKDVLAFAKHVETDAETVADVAEEDIARVRESFKTLWPTSHKTAKPVLTTDVPAPVADAPEAS